MDKYSRSVSGRPRSEWEHLRDHLRDVGRTAAAFAGWSGASRLGLAAGLLHDIGKVSPEYQAYLVSANAGEAKRGPDHSTAGARVAIELYSAGAGRMIAFAVAGHHAGLADGRGDGGALTERLHEDHAIPDYAGWERHVTDLPTRDQLQPDRRFLDNPDYPGFHASFLTRMLFSCLVDADRLESEASSARARGEPPPARGGGITAAHRDTLRAHMARHRRDDTDLNRERGRILDHVVAKAALPPGLFTLTVPTGGGKTLASLSFALEHGIAHGLRRIIYVIPFTSIIEQTARVFEDVLGRDIILEHHSAFDWDRQRPPTGNDSEEEGPDGLAKLRRDSENWDAAIVVTTAVQFFESLFAARTGAARKLHNIAGSVVILDEAQTLPVQLLRPCMAALDALARNHGASIVLCTATQPALRRIDAALPRARDNTGPPQGFDIDEARELAPAGLFGAPIFARVTVDVRREPVSDEALAARFADQPRMLCIVHTRAHARALHGLIACQEGARHLTTLMCPVHRRAVLAQVRDDLANERPVRLVATSLIEAGVDVDFPEVWRAAAGLDSIAQAAGRCNREGRMTEPGRVVVFEPADRRPPPVIDSFYRAAGRVLETHDDVFGLEAVRAYFQELYFRQGYAALDAAAIEGRTYPIIPAIAERKSALDFPFATIARAFRMIDTVMAPVLVPFDDAAEAAMRVLAGADKPPAAILRTLQQYTVPIPAKARQMLLGLTRAEAIRPDLYGDRFIRLTDLALYSASSGFDWSDPTFMAAESQVM